MQSCHFKLLITIKWSWVTVVLQWIIDPFQVSWNWTSEHIKAFNATFTVLKYLFLWLILCFSLRLCVASPRSPGTENQLKTKAETWPFTDLVALYNDCNFLNFLWLFPRMRMLSALSLTMAYPFDWHVSFPDQILYNLMLLSLIKRDVSTRQRVLWFRNYSHHWHWIASPDVRKFIYEIRGWGVENSLQMKGITWKS